MSVTPIAAQAILHSGPVVSNNVNRGTLHNQMEIVPIKSYDGLCDILLREKQMERRRRAQIEHYHKDIWTKEPHGGRYVNVSYINCWCRTAEWTRVPPHFLTDRANVLADACQSGLRSSPGR